MAKKIKKVETPIDQRETFVSIQKNFADSELSVEEKLKTLYALQKADSEIDKILQLRGELPVEVENLENEVLGLKTRAAQINTEIDTLNSNITDYKHQIVECDTAIEKYKNQMDSVTNSREYDSLSKEVENQDLLKKIAVKNVADTKEIIAAKKAELADIKDALKVKQAGWHLFKTNKNVRRAVFLGVLLQAMQQFTGFNVIMYYSPKILSLAGFSSTEDQMIGTVLNGIVFTLSTFIAISMVDKSGRKPALKIGFGVMALSMAAVGICMSMLESGTAPAWVSYFAAVMTMVSIAGFGMSAGPIVWVLCSEIQPLKSREFGIACSTMTNWITCAIVGATFLSLVDTLGSAHTFWLYAFLNGFFIVLTMAFVPETKNVTLEQIEKNLMSGKKLRDIGC